MKKRIDDAVIRDFVDGDSEELKALWRAAGLGNYPNRPDQDLENIRATGAGRIFVMERDGQLVATATAAMDGHRGWIYYVAVAPEYQRQGLGRRIIEYAESWLMSAGVPKVLLLVRDTNSAVADFYEALGYVREPCFVMGRWLRCPDADEAVASKTDGAAVAAPERRAG